MQSSRGAKALMRTYPSPPRDEKNWGLCRDKTISAILLTRSKSGSGSCYNLNFFQKFTEHIPRFRTFEKYENIWGVSAWFERWEIGGEIDSVITSEIEYNSIHLRKFWSLTLEMCPSKFSRFRGNIQSGCRFLWALRRPDMQGPRFEQYYLHHWKPWSSHGSNHF